ncbi:type I phosphomannose isomerase catalytic subunit [uncultured Faecalicoccus sp.]|uniref:type I phosphomannose isomerase catalytic subunit n=1 Tax=uncultured Faecalicoccus sp. TaxID=1971760 RepID=UPI002611A71B|nr:type I phosphomannose isomerase catalytic subunit [uncultured Faecalicoccus sp.]
MAMIKLAPAYKDYIWGGTNLKEKYGKKCDLDIVAESWEVSTHPDGPSIVASGQDAGKTLTQYIEQHGKDCLGTEGKKFEFFPMLIKFIDSKQPLSIQVHPDNEYALRVEKEYGKTEMWYILDCEEGATLYFGVNQSITKEEFRKRIEDNTILEVLKEVPVHKGDVFFIKAGTIHAIGAGITLCEIQQNSNSTYRVYDFGRVGKDGKPRELHIDKAIDVSNLDPIDSDFKPAGQPVVDETAETVLLGTCDYFTSFETTLKGTTVIDVDDESFGTLVLVEGKAVLENNGETLDLDKGETAFIEAGSGKVTVTGNCRWIYSRV